jgi:hypothetical protein
MREYLADFDVEFRDIRGGREFAACYDPNSYAVGQQLGVTLLAGRIKRSVVSQRSWSPGRVHCLLPTGSR